MFEDASWIMHVVSLKTIYIFCNNVQGQKCAEFRTNISNNVLILHVQQPTLFLTFIHNTVYHHAAVPHGWGAGVCRAGGWMELFSQFTTLTKIHGVRNDKGWYCAWPLLLSASHISYAGVHVFGGLMVTIAWGEGVSPVPPPLQRITHRPPNYARNNLVGAPDTPLFLSTWTRLSFSPHGHAPLLSKYVPIPPPPS